MISEFSFPPASVRAGGTVTWKNNDPAMHSIVWDTLGSPPDITAPIGSGQLSAPVTMPTPGTFHYHCGIHPSMRGMITVGPQDHGA